MQSAQLPPHSTLAEQSVLGAILVDNESIYKSLELIKSSDFYKTPHQHIYSAMAGMCVDSQQINLLSLSDQLKKNGHLEAIGGVEYLDQLEQVIPTSQAITSHCKIVRDKKTLRSLIEIARDMMASSLNESVDVDDFIRECEQKIYNLSDADHSNAFVNVKEVVHGSFSQIEAAYENKSNTIGIPSGFKKVDAITSGFQNSDLIIIAARPSIGKTTFAVDIATNISLSDEPVHVAVFSLEMSKEQLGIKFLCSKAKVNSQNVRKGWVSNSDWPSLTSAAGSFSESNFIEIDDSPTISPMQIRAKLRRLNSKLDNNVGLIIIDHLQFMTSDEKKENRNLEIGSITAGLKRIAKEFKIPVIALSHLNRLLASRTDKRPILTDLKESGSIEGDADVVILMHREEYYNRDTGEQGIAEINIAKQRNGPVGTAKLAFIKEYPSFRNLQEDGF